MQRNIEVHNIPKGISPKMNLNEGLKFELAYSKATV